MRLQKGREDQAMQCNVLEIAPETYRLSTFHPDYGIQFNQILVNDDEPFLMHTGFKHSFECTLAGLSTVIDPALLRWIGFSHFESDECGALNEWLRVAPQAQAVCSFVSAKVNLQDFGARAPRALADGETFSTGRHTLQFLATPHVPHGWDAGLFFDETEGTLLCSDLFFQPGDPEPLINSGITDRARRSVTASLAGPLAKDMPFTPYTCATLERLADLKPTTLATMHGSSYRGDGESALRELAETVKEVLGE